MTTMTVQTAAYHPCILCGKNDYEKIRPYPGFTGIDVVTCRVCRLWQAQPIPSDQFLNDFYQTEFGNDPLCGFEMNAKSEKGFRLRATMQLDFVDKWCRWNGGERKALDVGCHAASFLSLFKARGWNVTGIDPNPRSEYAKKWYDIDVMRGMFKTGLFAENTFDLILHSHVLEHVGNPKAYLAEFRRILKPGGYVFIEVPNESTDTVTHDGLIPHLYFFTPETLSALGRAAGLEVITTTTLGVAPNKHSLFSSKGLSWLGLRYGARYDARGNLNLLTSLPFFGKMFKEDRYFKGYHPKAVMLRVLLRKAVV